MNLKKLEPHPLGSLFPPMNDTDYAALCDSLKAHGFDEKQPIILFEDKILDGNNRYTACKKTKTTPIFEQYRGADPVGYVMARNLARRNLTPSQLATIGAEMVVQMQNQEEALKAAGTKLPKKRGGTKTAKAAKAVGVSARQVAKAAALKKKDPKAFKDVQEGKQKLGGADKKAATKRATDLRQTPAFDQAEKLVSGLYGDALAHQLGKTMPPKDFIKLSGITPEEAARIKPHLEASWGLKAALGFKSEQLSAAHTIRQLIDRTIAQGGTFDLLLSAYDTDFRIAVTTEPK